MIGNDWDTILKNEFKKSYFKELQSFLKEERNLHDIFPKEKDMLNALKITSFESTKVIIIGQDPYHGKGQAHGLSFSVQDKSLKIPPSLKNIYKELKGDLGIEPASHANLTNWANQGVLLLNSVLTVRASEPASHRKKGWEEFTNIIVESLNTKKKNLVFILWGNDAKKKGSMIDREAHLVLESAHPSPFSVKNFTGNKHFSKTNDYLAKYTDVIDWEL